MTAMMFEVYAMNGWRVMESTAGMESSAKTTSVISTATSARKRMVAMRRSGRPGEGRFAGEETWSWSVADRAAMLVSHWIQRGVWVGSVSVAFQA